MKLEWLRTLRPGRFTFTEILWLGTVAPFFSNRSRSGV